VPTVVGNLEFRVWKNQLERIDEILRMSQTEAAFVRLVWCDRRSGRGRRRLKNSGQSII